MKKVIFWSAIAALFLALLEAAVLSNITILPALPDLVLLLVVYVALKNGSAAGCTCGFLAGMILDFVSAAPLGLNAMTKTITGFLLGKFHASFNLQRPFIPFLAAAVATVLKAVLVWILSFFFGEEILRYRVLSAVLWFETAANAVCAPLLFKLLDAFSPLFIRKNRDTAS